MTDRCIHGFEARQCASCRAASPGQAAVGAVAGRSSAPKAHAAESQDTEAQDTAESDGPSASYPGSPQMDALGMALQASSIRTIPVAMQSTNRLVQVTAYLRTERPWAGDLPANYRTVPNKAAIDFEGVPLYPEFVILRLLERAGWGAAWLKNWAGAAFWSDISQKIEPPARAQAIFDQISQNTGFAGAWDVFAWRGRDVLFIASKPLGHDRISAYQARWLDVAIRMGMPLSSFAIVEYQLQPAT